MICFMKKVNIDYCKNKVEQDCILTNCCRSSHYGKYCLSDQTVLRGAHVHMYARTKLVKE